MKMVHVEDTAFHRLATEMQILALECVMGLLLYVRNKGAKGSFRNGARTFFEEVQKLENITRDMSQRHNMKIEEIMTLPSHPGSTVREMIVNTMAKCQVHGSSRASVAKRETSVLLAGNVCKAAIQGSYGRSERFRS